MLHTIWNRQAPYRVAADASVNPHANAWNLANTRMSTLRAPTVTPLRRLPTRVRPVATVLATVLVATRQPEPAHPLINAMQQARPDLAALIEHTFRPMRQALLGTAFLRQALRELAPMLPRAPRGLPGLPQVLLINALATAVGTDAPRAAAALAALRQMDPLREIAQAWRLRGEPCAAPSPDCVTAWRVAMELAATASGMAVLQAVLDVPVAVAQQAAFIALLRTTRQIASEVRQPLTPLSALHCVEITCTALGKVLANAAACLAGAADSLRPAALRPADARRTRTSGLPSESARPRSEVAFCVPFSNSAMVGWSFANASRSTASIATAMSEAWVRRITRPVLVDIILPAPRPMGASTP